MQVAIIVYATVTLTAVCDVNEILIYRSLDSEDFMLC